MVATIPGVMQRRDYTSKQDSEADVESSQRQLEIQAKAPPSESQDPRNRPHVYGSLKQSISKEE